MKEVPLVASLASPAEPAGYRLGFMCLMAAIIGGCTGVIAFLLYSLIGLCTNLAFYHVWSFHFRSPQANHLGPWAILVPVMGGLIVGVMAKYGSEKIKGHGIPEAMEAVLTSRSRIQAKVAILKPLSAAIAIGTGGPFGAEGPIIQTGGAFGSLVGQLISTTAAERKVLLACGAAAGMAATFNTPIAGVILAIELLLFEFRARSFIPLVIASVLATIVHFLTLGRNPMFQFGNVDFGIPSGLPYFIALGLLCGAAAIGFTKLLYWVEDIFARLPIGDLWHPAIGALFLGIIGFFVPRVLGVGYDTISDILNNQLTLKLLLLLLVFKSLALVLSLGSGTSGGLLAPMFMGGAAMGGVYATVVNRLIPSAHLAPGAYALVAMAAVFGAASRATFALIVFAFEITHDYNAVLPLMLVCVIADFLALRHLPNSIMTEKLARRGLRTHAEYETNVLKQARVGEVMAQDVDTVPATMSVHEVADRIAKEDPRFTHHRGLPITDGQDRLVGIVTRGDILRALQKDPRGDANMEDAGTKPPVVSFPDETVFDALSKMLRNNIGRLPVVDRADPQKLVGYLGRAGVLASWGRHLEDESLREHGWLRRFRRETKGEGSRSPLTVIGRVIGIEEKWLKISAGAPQRTAILEFVLPRPIRGVSLGDEVRISYQEEGGQRIAHSVEELARRQ